MDGLDKCSIGQSNQVLKIIGGAKFLNYNIILTSRYPSTKKFEKYFETVISVEGVTFDISLNGFSVLYDYLGFLTRDPKTGRKVF